jgi:hypothetical protein
MPFGRVPVAGNFALDAGSRLDQQRCSEVQQHERGDVMNNGNRYDTVGLKFAETLVDVSYDAQEKSAELRKAYLKAFQERQKTTYDLTFAPRTISAIWGFG